MLNSELERADRWNVAGSLFNGSFYMHFTALGKPWTRGMLQMILSCVARGQCHPLLLELWLRWDGVRRRGLDACHWNGTDGNSTGSVVRVEQQQHAG